MASPQPWVLNVVRTHITSHRMAFVGVGDITPYMHDCMRQMMEMHGSADDIFIVAPDIETGWDGSKWSELLPELPKGHRIGITADRFFDELANVYIMSVLDRIYDTLSTTTGASQAFAESRDGILQLTSLEALQWFRDCAVPRVPGVLRKGELPFRSVLIALGIRASGGGVRFCDAGRAVADDVEYTVLVAVEAVTPEDLSRDARRRLESLRSSRGRDAGSGKFLVSGVDRRIVPVESLRADIVDDIDPDDVLVGVMAGVPEFVYADEVVL